MNKSIRILLIISLLWCFCCFGQEGDNLVVNPSFEDMVACPTAEDQLYNCVDWTTYGSVEYFNSCSSSSDVSVPYNWGGYQQPSSGNGYVGIFTAGDSSFGYSCIDSSSCDSREYIGQWLSSPLTIGTKYYITIKTSLSISNTINCNCATNNLGVLFSMNQPDFGIPNPTLIRNFAHVVYSTIVTDSSSWTEISGTFIADSAYQYIIIGNFFDDPNTSTQIMDMNTYCNAYYFIDDVCVSSDSSYCTNYYYTEAFDTSFSNNIFVYPNPADDQIKIDLTNIVGNATVKLFNAQGQQLINKEIPLGSSFTTFLNVQDLSDGIYLLEANINNSIYYRKIIINH